jgi:hypothetical protein
MLDQKRIRADSFHQCARGLISVGHGVRPPGAGGAAAQIITIASSQTGLLVDKASVNSDKIDASIVEMVNPDGVISETGVFQSSELRPFSDLLADVHAAAAGQSITLNQTMIPFTLEVFSANFPLPSVGNLKNVVRVRSTVAGAFKTGRSGTPWIVFDAGGDRLLAMIQVATDTSTNNKVGYGQILDQTTADWAVDRMSQEPGVIPGSARVIGYI